MQGHNYIFEIKKGLTKQVFETLVKGVPQVETQQFVQSKNEPSSWSALSLGDVGNVTFHYFPTYKKLYMQVFSWDQDNVQDLLKYTAKTLHLHSGQIKVSGLGEHRNQCQEPNCRDDAVKNWKGREVCQDHYEQYENQLFRNMADLDDVS